MLCIKQCGLQNITGLADDIGIICQKAHGAVAGGAQLTRDSSAGRIRLILFCSQSLSRQKVPRSIDFEDQLPRLPTGKLYKRLLRDRYWGDKRSRIV